MFKTIAYVILLALFSTTPVASQSQSEFTFVRVSDIQANYTFVDVLVPHINCRLVTVPMSPPIPVFPRVYPGIVLNGGGGVVIAPNHNRSVPRYTQEQHCETFNTVSRERVLDGYVVTYFHQHSYGRIHTQYYFPIGSVVSMYDLTRP